MARPKLPARGRRARCVSGRFRGRVVVVAAAWYQDLAIPMVRYSYEQPLQGGQRHGDRVKPYVCRLVMPLDRFQRRFEWIEADEQFVQAGQLEAAA